MFNSKATKGATAGTLIAIVWVAFGGAAALLVAALAAGGWMLGMIFDRPDILIGWLQRIKNR